MAAMIQTTLPSVRDIEPIPGALKMGSFTEKERGVEVVNQQQKKSSYGVRYGHAMMAGTTCPKLAPIKF
jgi:hypothetical protein